MIMNETLGKTTFIILDNNFSKILARKISKEPSNSHNLSMLDFGSNTGQDCASHRRYVFREIVFALNLQISVLYTYCFNASKKCWAQLHTSKVKSSCSSSIAYNKLLRIF